MEKRVTLSARLNALAELVTPGRTVCDVGCDHGFLSIYLVQQGISPKVLAMDVRTGPLSRAQEHIREYEMEAYIESRLSDGLLAMKPGEAEALVCAGMGGRLMQKILTQSRDKAQGLKELILQPQSELGLFREFLRYEGYQTIAENMIEEEGKYYPMMKVMPTGKPIACEEPLYDLYGRELLEKRHPVLKQYLLQHREAVMQIRDRLPESREGIEEEKVQESRTAVRLREVEEELTAINRALGWYA